MPSTRSPRGIPRLIAFAVGVMIVGSCTTTSWQTSGIDHPTTTTIPHYPQTVAGLEASITDHLSADGPDLNTWAPSRTEAKCAAQGIVGRLGLNRLLDLGYQTQVGSLDLPYTDDERTSLTGILMSCINFREGLLSLISGYDKLDIGSSECLTDGLDRQGLTRAFAAAFLNGSEPDPLADNSQLGAGMGALLAQCLTPSSDLVPGSPVARFPSELSGTTTTTQPSATTSSPSPSTSSGG